MSSISTPLPPAPSPEPVFRLSVEQYHQMIDRGVLTEDDPVELIEGVLVYKMPKKPKHGVVIRKLVRAIGSLVSTNYFIQIQDPITLRTSEPEPDIAVVRGEIEDYVDQNPGPEDVALLIEVSDATIRRDRGTKLRMYARAGIAVYWIVDLASRSVEVYTDPDPRSVKPTYINREVFGERSKIPVEIAGKVIGKIRVANLLP
jgi:Uma2 family endonuclease